MKLMSSSFSSVRFLLVSVFLTILILLAGCGQGDPVDAESPLIEDFAIAYIKRPVESLDTQPDLGNSDGRGPKAIPRFPVELEFDQDTGEPIAGTIPGDVYVRDLSSPSASETNITRHLTAPITTGQNLKSAGDVSDLEVNYNGTKLVFSLHVGMDPNENDDDNEPRWNIYEYDLTQPLVPGTNPKPLMGDLEALKGHDIDPHYLPDGRIVFVSDRQTSARSLQAITGISVEPTLDEEEQDPAIVLHVMEGNGTNIKQISFAQSHEFNPSVLLNGKILFTRWERTGNRDAFSLYTINPDGTDLDIYYGAHSHDPSNSERAFLDAKEMQGGGILSILTSYNRPYTTLPDPADPDNRDADLDPNENHFNDGEMVIIDSENFVEIDQKRITSPSLSTEGQYSATNNEVPRNGDISQIGRFFSPHPIWEEDGGNRVLVAWSTCRMTNSQDDVIRVDPLRDAQGNIVRDAEGNIENPADAIVPCISDNLNNAGLKEAPPFYGVYIYDLGDRKLLPIVVPPQDDLSDGIDNRIAVVNPVAIIDRPYDQTPVILTENTDELLASDGVGILHIRSVYDTQGTVPMVDTPLEPAGATPLSQPQRDAIPMTTAYVDPLTGAISDTNSSGFIPRTVADIPRLADPMQTPGSQRVARFVRFARRVPFIDDNNLNNNDWGRAGRYRLREILGYAPVEPDGSVYTRVPAEVSFTIEVLDGQGRAFMAFNSWLHVMPGETRECNGCHSPRDGQQSINQGAAGSNFPNTDDVLVQNGETMAQARARSEPGYVNLDMDLVDNNVWPTIDEVTEFKYDELTTPKPISNASCEDNWNWGNSKCRIIITYVTHIQPIFEATRQRDLGAGMMDYMCTSCHNDDDIDVVPPGDLVLENDLLDLNPNHVTVQAIRANRTNPDRPPSYEMLSISRPRAEVGPMGGTRFIVIRDPVTDVPIDVDGNPIGETDFNNLQFDAPARGALLSGTGVARARFSRLVSMILGDIAPGTVDHTQLLTDGEKRLILEWIDNGMQITNDLNIAISTP